MLWRLWCFMCWDSTWNKEIVEALLLEQKSIYIYIFISENTCKDLMCHCNIQCIFQTDAVSSRRTWYSMVVLSKCSIALMKMHLCLEHVNLIDECYKIARQICLSKGCSIPSRKAHSFSIGSNPLKTVTFLAKEEVFISRGSTCGVRTLTFKKWLHAHSRQHKCSNTCTNFAKCGVYIVPFESPGGKHGL